MSIDDDDRGLATVWIPLLVSLLVIGLLWIAVGTGWDGSSNSVTAAATPTTAATAPAPPAAPAATTPSSAPVEVQEDPLVKRLAHGRTLPFTAGAWQKARWRNAVYRRLRPVTQRRAEKVAQDGGFGILIQ